jgi:hypothetical protein
VLSDLDAETDEAIPIPNVTGPILEKVMRVALLLQTSSEASLDAMQVIDYCTHHQAYDHVCAVVFLL